MWELECDTKQLLTKISRPYGALQKVDLRRMKRSMRRRCVGLKITKKWYCVAWAGVRRSRLPTYKKPTLTLCLSKTLDFRPLSHFLTPFRPFTLFIFSLHFVHSFRPPDLRSVCSFDSPISGNSKIHEQHTRSFEHLILRPLSICYLFHPHYHGEASRSIFVQRETR